MIVGVDGSSEAAVDLQGVVAQAARDECTYEDALRRVEPADIEHLLHASFEDVSAAELTRGIGASPGAAVGRVCLTAQAALDAADRNEPVILVRQETSPDDVAGMSVSEVVLTARGGLASHAALVCRGELGRAEGP